MISMRSAWQREGSRSRHPLQPAASPPATGRPPPPALAPSALPLPVPPAPVAAPAAGPSAVSPAKHSAPHAGSTAGSWAAPCPTSPRALPPHHCPAPGHSQCWPQPQPGQGQSRSPVPACGKRPPHTHRCLQAASITLPARLPLGPLPRAAPAPLQLSPPWLSASTPAEEQRRGRAAVVRARQSCCWHRGAGRGARPRSPPAVAAAPAGPAAAGGCCSSAG